MTVYDVGYFGSDVKEIFNISRIGGIMLRRLRI